MPSTSPSLLQRLREPGAGPDWDRFVTIYSPLLFSWARQVGLRDAEAADLVQDVFVVLVSALPHFEYDAGKGFRKWLRTIVLNKWREGLRRRAAAPAVVAEPALDELPAPPGDEPFWEVEYRRQVTHRLLETIRGDFEPTTWQACWATLVEGRPAAEVARALHLSVGAVRAAKFRVLCRLREEARGLLD